MDRISQTIYSLFVKPVLRLYLRRDTRMRVDGFSLHVKKNVFHPSFFFSTRYFYDFLNRQDLKDVKLLEIGCGAGLLSMLAYRKGAKVTAVDIDLNAVDNTRYNFRQNFQREEDRMILQSDLFAALPVSAFDVVVINPPFYFRRPERPGEHAWYCGANGEYYEALFAGLSAYIHTSSRVFMVLPESPELARVSRIAAHYDFQLDAVDTKKIAWEKNHIFSISTTSADRQKEPEKAELPGFGNNPKKLSPP